jgi:Na+/proline symporter
MRSSGHLLKRAGREFVRNLLWMAVVFGSLAAILAAVTDLSLLEVMAFVGVCVVVMAAIVTVGVLWSGAHGERRLGGHADSGSPPETRGGWWDGGEGDGGGWGS